jgi:hypothetical protein
LNVKSSCAVATTANITLSGEQTIDGVVTSDSRVLVKDQSSASENGVYVTASGSWARATDFDAPAEVASSFVFISGGTAGADTGWVCTNEPESVTVDTDDITFSQFSDAGHITAGTGLTKSGNSISINASQSTITSIGTLSGATPLVFEGDTANDYETSISVTDPTADNTWTIPDSTDTFVGKATTDILTNKTLTSPRIGTSILDTSGNELFNLTATSSAVNEFTVANSATGNSPTISATGGDSNIDITITPKGTGEVNIGAGNLNYAGTAITATGAEINLLDGITTLSGSNTGDQTLPTDFVSAASGGTFSGNVSFGDNNITNVGDISLDSISSDAGTSINVVLGSDAGDDFTVDTSKLVVEGDTGNVGIGTASPLGLLHIEKDMGDTSADLSTMSSHHLVLATGGGTNDTAGIGFYASGNEYVGAAIQFKRTSNAGTGDLTFYVKDTADESSGDEPTAVMTMNDDGNVGIGTNDPWSPLDVSGPEGANLVTLGNRADAGDDISIYLRSNGTANFHTPGAGNITFSPGASVKVSMLAGGNVGIGVTDPTSPAGVDRVLELSGTSAGIVLTDADEDTHWEIYNAGSTLYHYNGAQRLTIAADGTFTGSGSADISDRELKENINSIENGLDTIKQLQGRTFTWKEEADMQKGTKYGLIAQELEEVLPDLVYDECGIRQKEDGTWYKSISTNGVIPVIIEAIKELSAKVTALENA